MRMRDPGRTNRERDRDQAALSARTGLPAGELGNAAAMAGARVPGSGAGVGGGLGRLDAGKSGGRALERALERERVRVRDVEMRAPKLTTNTEVVFRLSCHFRRSLSRTDRVSRGPYRHTTSHPSRLGVTDDRLSSSPLA